MFNRSVLLQNSSENFSTVTNYLNHLIEDIDNCFESNIVSIPLDTVKYNIILNNNYEDVLIHLLNEHYNLVDSFRIENSTLVFYSIKYKLSLSEFESSFGKIVHRCLDECLKDSKRGLFKSIITFPLSRLNCVDCNAFFEEVAVQVQVHLKTHFELDSELSYNEKDKTMTVTVSWN